MFIFYLIPGVFCKSTNDFTKMGLNDGESVWNIVTFLMEDGGFKVILWASIK